MDDFKKDVKKLKLDEFKASDLTPSEEQDGKDVSLAQWGCFRCFRCFNCFRCFACFRCFRCFGCGRCW